MLQDFVAARSISPKDLERLHGRLVWFNSYVFGRRLNRAVKVISRYSRFNGRSVSVSTELQVALDDLLRFVSAAEPASISRCMGQTWFVFSDGAFEPGHEHPATIGAVLVDPCGRVCSFFGEAIPEAGISIFTQASFFFLRYAAKIPSYTSAANTSVLSV